MKQRFRLYRRSCGGRFYVRDQLTGKQESLGTTDRTEALRLLYAKNEAQRQSLINVQIARAYLAASDTDIGTRTWQAAMNELTKTKHGNTYDRHVRAFKDQALGSIRPLPILQTRPEHFMTVQRFGEEVAAILRQLPTSGPLFPKLAQCTSSNRAARFAKALKRRGIVGVSLHSYRYAWAERAKIAGYPERYAREALGHKSKAVHRAYARKARVACLAHACGRKGFQFTESHSSRVLVSFDQSLVCHRHRQDGHRLGR